MTGTPTHPPCVACGGPVLRRVGEGRAKWLSRKTCRDECRYVVSGMTTKAATARRDQEAAKPCLACGKLMRRGASEGRERFAGRTACSRKCQGRVYTMRAYGRLAAAPKRPRGDDPPPSAHLKPCVVCDKPIPWPQGLTAGAYHNKSTCGGPECRHGQQGGRPATARLAAEIVSPPSSLYQPSEAQRREWLQASPDVRRLFAPEIRAALGGANA